MAKRVRSLSKRGADAFKKGIKGVRKASGRQVVRSFVEFSS